MVENNFYKNKIDPSIVMSEVNGEETRWNPTEHWFDLYADKHSCPFWHKNLIEATWVSCTSCLWNTNARLTAIKPLSVLEDGEERKRKRASGNHWPSAGHYEIWEN